jgi:hypothetical protein
MQSLLTRQTQPGAVDAVDAGGCHAADQCGVPI